MGLLSLFSKKKPKDFDEQGNLILDATAQDLVNAGFKVWHKEGDPRYIIFTNGKFDVGLEAKDGEYYLYGRRIKNKVIAKYLLFKNEHLSYDCLTHEWNAPDVVISCFLNKEDPNTITIEELEEADRYFVADNYK